MSAVALRDPNCAEFVQAGSSSLLAKDIRVLSVGTIVNFTIPGERAGFSSRKTRRLTNAQSPPWLETPMASR
jgi:hypothetical protein